MRTIAKNRKKVDAEFCGWYILRHKNSNQRQKMNALHNNVVSFPLSHASFSSYNPISEQDALSSLQDLFNRAGERHKDNERLVAHVEKSTKVCSVTITPFQDLEMAFTALIEKVNKNWKNLHNDSRFNFFKELIGFRLQWIKEGNERMIKIEEIERNYSQSLNHFTIPEGTPIHFKLTADNAPMNSFWIPQLSGQIYSMTGMTTQLNVMAQGPGIFQGRAVEINGEGYADMTFLVTSTPKQDFEKWVEKVKDSPHHLTEKTYDELLKPSIDRSMTLFSQVKEDLFHEIVHKYMYPSKPVL